MPGNTFRMPPIHRQSLLEEARRFGLPDAGRVLYVSVTEQKLWLLDPEGDQTFPCSTSRAGTGYEEGSFKTPTGWHRICAWIGADHPPGTVWSSRQPTGEILPATSWKEDGDQDLILSRILWLDGLEAGKNDNTRQRYIYLHGTNHEQELGNPSSHGCIRMGNLDIMALFDRTLSFPTFCLISHD